jgi:hypothetical protein
MKYFVLLSSILIMSCSLQKTILTDYNSEGFDITSIKGSSIGLHVNPVINAGPLRKEFESKYLSDNAFCSFLSGKIKEKLDKFTTVRIDTEASTDDLFRSQSISEENISRAKGLSERTNDNFLIGIRKVTISISMDQNSPPPESAASTGNVRGRQGPVQGRKSEIIKPEDCEIRIVVEVWSVKEKKRVAEFTSIGQSKAFLMMYERALDEALDNSVSSLADYIREKKEY